MSTMEFLLTRAEKLEDMIKRSLEMPHLLSNSTKTGIFVAGLAAIFTLGLLLNMFINTPTSKSSLGSKTQRSRHMKQAFNEREKENESEILGTEVRSPNELCLCHDRYSDCRNSAK
jgi:hypothetical protein